MKIDGDDGFMFTRPLRLGDGGEEGHETGAAEELSDEDGGVGLSLRGADPMETMSKNAIIIATFSKNATSITTHDRSVLISPDHITTLYSSDDFQKEY